MLRALVAVVAATGTTVASAQDTGIWRPQGPAPITNGQVSVPNQIVSGAIHTVVAHPENPDVLWVGTVNGGLWKTLNARAGAPVWTPLTDDKASLSTGALELDPTDSTHNTLVAGVGRYSSFSSQGGRRTGLLRTTDGGATWTELDGGGLLSGANISGVAPRGGTIVVSNSLGCSTAGVLRSTDGGQTFARVSGTGAGLPGGDVFDLAGDPTDPSVLYAAVRSLEDCEAPGASGIYKSLDTGATWLKVSSAEIDAVMAAGFFLGNTEIAVGQAHEVYVALVVRSVLAGLFRSGDAGATWTALDTPDTNPGQQGYTHFSIRADRLNPYLVYIAGDRGSETFPGWLFRVDATRARGAQAVPLSHCPTVSASCPEVSTPGDTAPHADSREMTFDAAGDLLETDDGGIYRRPNPAGAGDWSSVIGNLQLTEMHNVAYDSVSHRLISGNQDNGTAEQTARNGLVWRLASGGDGGDVQVDDAGSATQSIRYSSSQYLRSFQRRTVDASGVVLRATSPRMILVGDGPAFNGQFVTPVELNAVDPTRILFAGTGALYESLDRGDTIAALRVSPPALVNAMVYGGRTDGAPNADLLYVAANASVYRRLSGGGAPTLMVSPTTATLRDIAVDPADGMRVYVIDAEGKGFASSDGALSWTDVTGDMGALSTDLRTLVFVPGASNRLFAGGLGGVFRMAIDSPGVWRRFGTGLPNVTVWDMEYDPIDDVLVAGTLGRGAWTLPLTPPAPAAALSIDDVSVSEGDAPATSAVFTVRLSAASATPVTVQFATADGLPNPATAASDYVPTSGTLTFPPGTTTQTVSVLVVGDNDIEVDEVFTVTLTSAVGATIADAQARGIIVNDDLPERPPLSGHVTDTEGRPLSGVNVFVYHLTQGFAGSVLTNAAGAYTVNVTAPGVFFARTFNALGYVDKIYDGIFCRFCPITSVGTRIDVGPQGRDGIDFALAPGGYITGLMQDAATGAPLGGVDIYVYTASGELADLIEADFSGSYASSALPAGSYRLQTSNEIGYIDEVYDNIACLACDYRSGRPVVVTPSSTTKNIDFGLSRGGRVAGRVIDGLTGRPVSGTYVTLFDAPGRAVAYAYPDTTGNYLLATGLPSGTYFATAQRSAYTRQLYQGIDCTPSCRETNGTPITVTAGTTTGAIDFTLMPTLLVAGRVTDAGTGLPVAGVLVDAYTPAGGYVKTASSGADGRYTLALNAGTYRIRTDNISGYLDELYNNRPCLVCDVTVGDPVTVTATAPTIGIDFALERGGTFAGRITDAAGAPLQGVEVALYNQAGQEVGGAGTRADGRYTVRTAVPTGTYYARTFNTLGFIDEAYGDLVCAPCTVTTGAPITITAPNQTGGIDFVLARGARIAGRLTDEATGAALAGGRVLVYDGEGRVVTTVVAATDGRYTTTTGLPAGTFFARGRAATADYLAELYQDQVCTRCPVTVGTGIAVTPPTTTDGIHFALRKAVGMTLSPASVVEGNGGTTQAQLTVRLSIASTQPVTVGFETADGTARSGADYTARTGTLTFAPGTVQQSIAVEIAADGLNEPDETFLVRLTEAAGAVVTDPEALGTIRNDDPEPSLSVDDVVAVEGVASGAVFIVRLSSPSGRPVTVKVKTADGSGVAGSDYVAAEQTLSFAPGTSEQTVAVALLDDARNEGEETFTLGLSEATNAVIVRAVGTAQVTDDDPEPSLAVDDVSLVEGDAASTMATFTVTLSAESSREVTVDFATADGTATAGSDYAAVAGTLSFAPGVTRQTIAVAIAGDTVGEVDERFTVGLASPVHAVLGTAVGAGVIANDDDFERLPVADTYVRNGRYDRTNFGTATLLQVERGLLPGSTRRSFLRFDLVDLPVPRISKATLRLFVQDLDRSRERMGLSAVHDDAWGETTVTWRKQPRVGASLGRVRVPPDGWMEVDVTAFVNAELAGDRRVSLALLDEAGLFGGLILASREASGQEPRLVLAP